MDVSSAGAVFSVFSRLFIRNTKSVVVKLMGGVNHKPTAQITCIVLCWKYA